MFMVMVVDMVMVGVNFMYLPHENISGGAFAVLGYGHGCGQFHEYEPHEIYATVKNFKHQVMQQVVSNKFDK